MVQNKLKKIYIKNKLYLICFILFFSCKNQDSELDIKNWNENHNKTYFIKFIDNEKVFFYDGKPIKDNYLEGKLIVNNNKIFFESNNLKKLKFVLFNFNLKKNECDNISYNKNGIIKKYLLCNEDIFYDDSIKDTIYKFHFKNYDILNHETGIVCFINKKKGIMGHYLIDLSNSKKSPSISEKMFGNVYSKRYDYSKYTKFIIE